MFKPLRFAKAHYGVCGNTLRAWADAGKIETIRTPAGQRLYRIGSLTSSDRRKVCYARVSSARQRDDLAAQVVFLQGRFPTHEVITDVGSGLNWKRKGFNALLDSVMSGEVGELVVAHKDRLCRFGFELFARVAERHNTKLVVLNDAAGSPTEELVSDLVSIIHVFSCRIYGMRKYASAVSKDPDLPRRGKPAKG